MEPVVRLDVVLGDLWIWRLVSSSPLVRQGRAATGGVVEVQKLPGWSPWSGWTSCSVTCGYGDSFRQAHWLDKDGQRVNETAREHMGCYIPKSCPGMCKCGLLHSRIMFRYV
eukprot:XP_019928846.1 PREDICTED: thrombospondin-2-like [Crassostrea gigas]